MQLKLSQSPPNSKTKASDASHRSSKVDRAEGHGHTKESRNGHSPIASSNKKLKEKGEDALDEDKHAEQDMFGEHFDVRRRIFFKIHWISNS